MVGARGEERALNIVLRYTSAAVTQENPLERLYRMLEQHLGRELTHHEKRLVSLSEGLGRSIEADPSELDWPPPKASGE